MNNEDKLLKARDIAESKENPDKALRLCNEVLNEEFDNPFALFLTAYVLMQADKTGLALNIYLRLQDMLPDDAKLMTNIAMCYEDFNLTTALDYCIKALKIDPDNTITLSNKALINLKLGRFDRAEKDARQALKGDSEFRPAHDNLSLSLLAQRKWKEGWEHYKYGLGGKFRKKIDFGVPEWDGKAEGNVVIYGEQGIGDEIMFASCIPDVLKQGNFVGIECDYRLQEVFRRSFDCDVSGTRYGGQFIMTKEPDYQCSIGDLPRFFRNKHKDFPGDAYLKPDPERCTQWRALLDQHKGKKIGIAWSGGVVKTGSERRSVNLETLAPLFETDNTFVSLEYNRPKKADLDKYGIIHWPRAVEKGVDFDETLALINELDLVISVCTTVVYGAGAIGKECWTLVPKVPLYRYHISGDFPWYKSVKFHRQTGEWSELIAKFKKKLEDAA